MGPHAPRAEDTLFSRKPFREAAKGAIEVYVDLHDYPPAAEAAAEEELLAAMTGEAGLALSSTSSTATALCT
jgi:hypothetical protein